MQVIPAIDIIDGKCVRLTQGNYAQKKEYDKNPLEMAKAFENAGLRRLHLVDLDGAKAGKIINWKTLEDIAANTNLQIDFGGGVKQKADVELILNSGALLVTVGSIAVNNQQLFAEWIAEYGAGKFFLGADVRQEKIAIHGWLETSDMDVASFISHYSNMGVENIFCTDVSKDGLLQGPSIDLYKKIIEKFPAVNLVASGGVSTLQDLYTLKSIGCSGAIIGKAIYENKIALKDLHCL